MNIKHVLAGTHRTSMRATLLGAVAALIISIPSAHADDHFATVTVDSVVIAPFDHSGTKWDGGAAATGDELRRYSELTRTFAAKQLNIYTATAAIATYALTLTAGLVEPPDVKGSVQMFFDGKRQPAIPLAKVQDSYTPRWSSLEWQRVSLDHDVKIRFVLDDNDEFFDDHIGTAVIDTADLRRAAASGKSYPIYVGDQPNGQILAINVFVVMERPAFAASSSSTYR
jgi:hypothetical protein